MTPLPSLRYINPLRVYARLVIVHACALWCLCLALGRKEGKLAFCKQVRALKCMMEEES